MTLDFKKLIRNNVLKEMKIQHYECNVQVFTKEELPAHVLAKFKSTYGDTYLLDSNYILFFSGKGITKDVVEKTLFKIVNKACGSSANNMTEDELKLIDFNAVKADKPAAAIDDVNVVNTPDSDGQNGRAISDVLASDDDSIDEIKDAVDAELDSEESETSDSAGAEELTDEPAPEPESDADDSGVADTDDAESAAEEHEDTGEEMLGPADGQAEDDDSAEGDDEEDEVEIDESVVYPDEGEKFVFLKITMK